MESIEITLNTGRHGSVVIPLYPGEEETLSGNECIYNDEIYSFSISSEYGLPTRLFVNEDSFEIETDVIAADTFSFHPLLRNQCPALFNDYFGTVCIKLEIHGKIYCSKSIAVMVTDTFKGRSILKMVEYISVNSRGFLYNETEYSSLGDEFTNYSNISIATKIQLLNEIRDIYRESYRYLQNNPYTKLHKEEKIVPFTKVTTFNPCTVQYIATHTDELEKVNFNTGIQYNKQFYQPVRTKAVLNVYSYDTYENGILLGFLKTIVIDITKTINLLKKKYNFRNRSAAPAGYIDSMYEIYQSTITTIANYIDTLTVLKDEYQKLYLYYLRLFNFKATPVTDTPIFTPAFRSVNAYRQLYCIIHKWFTCNSSEFSHEDLVLSFISSSKIYEYYCLIKILTYIKSTCDFKIQNSYNVLYKTKSKFNFNTKYNNTFIFQNNEIRLTVYFQPVISGNDSAENEIGLFRNTSTTVKNDATEKGYVYTPDYIIKKEYKGVCQYLILDAKFSTVDTIRQQRLQELVYKYLFSVSTINSEDIIKGLYIICGKSTSVDSESIVHDLAKKIGRKVEPFTEILTMSGNDTSNYYTPSKILDCIINS